MMYFSLLQKTLAMLILARFFLFGLNFVVLGILYHPGICASLFRYYFTVALLATIPGGSKTDFINRSAVQIIICSISTKKLSACFSTVPLQVSRSTNLKWRLSPSIMVS